ncbi:Translation initiation factor IF-2 [Dissostichus eleginoides]|uniref:Translation initiation factor IF-2 n=1 Tax=Dissostichus eleginoides TaxID=100907 RepID=A0AAD9EZR5_DISEL|nr:Translation initiation factor IF-2 [Dissostichus eleginoides]
MKGLLFLLCCVELLGSLLCGSQAIAGTTAAENLITPDPASTAQKYSSTFQETSLSDHTSEANIQSESPSPVSLVFSSHSTSMSSGTHRPTTISTTTTSTTAPFNMYRKECLPLFMVSGGLIIACTILLVSTLLLIWKVCQQSRRIKALSSNADLISTSEYWMGTAKRNKSASELEAKENTVLMSDIGQTQEKVGNGTTKEEGGKVKEDGPKEEKKKEEETAKSEEVSAGPATVAEKASKPQEEATDSKSTEAASTSNCKGTEEPKDKV